MCSKIPKMKLGGPTEEGMVGLISRVSVKEGGDRVLTHSISGGTVWGQKGEITPTPEADQDLEVDQLRERGPNRDLKLE